MLKYSHPVLEIYLKEMVWEKEKVGNKCIKMNTAT
jgi:hypothetical protein